MLDRLPRRSGLVPVSHHQFFLLDEDVFPEDGGRLTWPNGLATAAPGLVAIYTGIHLGPVHLVLERHGNPPEPEWESWGDVVEIAVDVPGGALQAGALMDDVPESLAEPVTEHPGTYRARIHARGRDNAVDLATSDPVEHYLVQLWPSTGTTPRTRTLTSHFGRTQMSP